MEKNTFLNSWLNIYLVFTLLNVFIYFFFQHKMYIKTGHLCYMADLVADERLAVHTDAGIKNLEVNGDTLRWGRGRV